MPADRFSLAAIRCFLSKDRVSLAKDRCQVAADRLSLEEDGCPLSEGLFSLEEDPCQRSTIRFQKTTIRFLVDEARGLSSALGEWTSEPIFTKEMPLRLESEDRGQGQATWLYGDPKTKNLPVPSR
jgi:hypothetical protein